jgi:hypothetical protein
MNTTEAWMSYVATCGVGIAEILTAFGTRAAVYGNSGNRDAHSLAGAMLVPKTGEKWRQ